MSEVAQVSAKPDSISRKTEQPAWMASSARFSRFAIAFALAMAALWLFWMQAKKTEDRWMLPEDLTAFRAISRIEDYLYSKERANCVLLGSSLMQGPAHQMDVVFEGVAVPPEQEDASEAMKTFTRSKHLKKLYAQSGQDYEPISLSVVSSSAADSTAIVRQLVNFEKTPKLIIIGVGLRDLCPAIHESPVRTRLRDLEPESKWASNPLSRLQAEIELSRSSRSLRRHLLEASWQFQVCRDYAARKLGLAGKYKRKTKGATKPDFTNASRTNMMLRMYEHFYNNAKPENVNAQLVQLQNTIKLASASGASVIVVLMPVSPEHMKVIPKELNTRFVDSMDALKKKFPITVSDQFTPVSYKETDFGDSIHMTGAAMDRMFQQLVPLSKELTVDTH